MGLQSGLAKSEGTLGSKGTPTIRRAIPGGGVFPEAPSAPAASHSSSLAWCLGPFVFNSRSPVERRELTALGGHSELQNRAAQGIHKCGWNRCGGARRGLSRTCQPLLLRAPLLPSSSISPLDLQEQHLNPEWAFSPHRICSPANL